MTKEDLKKELNLSDVDFNDALKGCGFSASKEFTANNVKAIKSYIKTAGLLPGANINEKKELVNTGSIEDTKSDLILAPRKEIMQLLTKAYDTGYKKGRTAIPVAGEVELEGLLKTALGESA